MWKAKARLVMIYSVDGDSHYSDEELDLACLLVSYETDQPHVNLPHIDLDEDQWYPERTKEQILEWLDGPHHGDCVNNPISCLRCEAETAVHKAKWLMNQNKFPN